MNYVRVMAAATLVLSGSVACSANPEDDDANSEQGDGNAGTDSGDSGTSDVHEGEFSMLSYNVAGLPEVLSGSNPSENMSHISPLLNDYDLALVQEDWLTPEDSVLPLEVYHDLLAKDAMHPYQSIPAPLPLGSDPSRPEALVSDGLNRFSMFEFGDLTRERWEGCYGGATGDGAGDCMATKGFSVATHLLPGGVEVDVYNLHGEAGSTDQDQALQVEDYLQFANFINMQPPARAIIVGGDTNLHTDPEDPDLSIWREFLEATGLSDVCDVVDCGSDATIIDKFAFRSGATVELEPMDHRFERMKFVHPESGAPLSDHDALAVDFHWSRR